MHVSIDSHDMHLHSPHPVAAALSIPCTRLLTSSTGSRATLVLSSSASAQSTGRPSGVTSAILDTAAVTSGLYLGGRGGGQQHGGQQRRQYRGVFGWQACEVGQQQQQP